MARNARPTAAKREREKALNERRQQKADAAPGRQAAEGRRKRRAPDGVDPDIADITPGPQPLADWQLEE